MLFKFRFLFMDFIEEEESCTYCGPRINQLRRFFLSSIHRFWLNQIVSQSQAKSRNAFHSHVYFIVQILNFELRIETRNKKQKIEEKRIFIHCFVYLEPERKVVETEMLYHYHPSRRCRFGGKNALCILVFSYNK